MTAARPGGDSVELPGLRIISAADTSHALVAHAMSYVTSGHCGSHDGRRSCKPANFILKFSFKFAGFQVQFAKLRGDWTCGPPRVVQTRSLTRKPSDNPCLVTVTGLVVLFVT